jgi:hypothetical protein
MRYVFENIDQLDEFCALLENCRVDLVGDENDNITVAAALFNAFDAGDLAENKIENVLQWWNRIASAGGVSRKRTKKDLILLYDKINAKNTSLKRLLYLARKNPAWIEPVVKKKSDIEKPKILQIYDFIERNFIIRKNEISSKYEWKAINGFLPVLSKTLIDAQKAGNEKFLPFLVADLRNELEAANIRVSKDFAENYICSSRVETYNPLREYLEALPPWDGNDHIKELMKFVRLDHSDGFSPETHFKKWFVRMVKCMVTEQEYFNKQMIVFIQSKQNGGKSTFCRFLCPPELQEYFTECVEKDKDGKRQLTTNFLIHFDELTELYKKGLEDIKQIMSTAYVNTRLPYARNYSLLKRRCSFIGNTNKTDFLTDETGSIRFICLKMLDDIDFSYKQKVDINRLYSQAYALYKEAEEKGEFAGLYELTKEDCKQIEQYNRRFYIQTPEAETVGKYFSPAAADDPGAVKMNATEILSYLYDHGANTNRLDVNRLGKALKFLGFTQTTHRRTQNATPLKMWLLLPLT